MSFIKIIRSVWQIKCSISLLFNGPLLFRPVSSTARKSLPKCRRFLQVNMLQYRSFYKERISWTDIDTQLVVNTLFKFCNSLSFRANLTDHPHETWVLIISAQIKAKLVVNATDQDYWGVLYSPNQFCKVMSWCIKSYAWLLPWSQPWMLINTMQLNC